MLAKLVQRSVFLLACLITVIALFYAEEDWRGKNAWDKYQREREAKGDSFDWLSIVPPAVPDKENFATTPLFAELFLKPPHRERLTAIQLPVCPSYSTDSRWGNWRMGHPEDLGVWQECFTNIDLVAALSRYDSVLDEVTEASHRTYCRFPLRYEDSIAMPIPQINPLRNLARIYKLRAMVKLAANQSDDALANVRTGLRLVNLLKDEPLLLSLLVRVGMLDIITQPVWEGLAGHRWNESQVKALQSDFEKIDQLQTLSRTMRATRIFFSDYVRWMREHPMEIGFLELFHIKNDGSPVEKGGWLDRAVPSGWYYQNQLNLDRFYTETLVPTVDYEQRLINSRACKQINRSIETMRTTPYNVLSKWMKDGYENAIRRTALSQTYVDEAVVACALERYRLAYGTFPEHLDILVPQFIGRLPHDMINGEPLHYHRAPDGQYVLYSVGWNEVDDGGQIALAGVNQNFDEGDWVWFSQPQPSASERK